jgi:hypothetical protein
VIREREIEIDWIEETIARPAWNERDAKGASLAHALRPIPARNDRVLRVVYNDRRTPWNVVTAFFDRREGRRR